MKISFFDRLASRSGDGFDSFDEELATPHEPRRPHAPRANERPSDDDPLKNEGQLPVDVRQTPTEIVIRAFVAGVRPDELNISISRDMVEISGSRAEREEAAASDHFIRELFWGSFSRTILLPQEVDVDASSANAKDGLLTLVLPKLDRARQTKLRVKAG